MNAPIVLGLRIFLAVILYGFISWALYLLWKDLKSQEPRDTHPASPRISLTGLTAEAPGSFSFDIPEIIVGRDPKCTLNLDDQTISVRHAVLSYHHSQWWVRDLGSTNGTFLNQERIDEPQVIASGDILQFGRVEFEFHSQMTLQAG